MIILHETCSSLYLMNESPGTDFPALNMGFSTSAFETPGTELFPVKYEILAFHVESGINKVTWNMEFFIFLIWTSVCWLSLWATEYRICNNSKNWPRFSYKKYGIFYFIQKGIFTLEVWSHCKWKHEVIPCSRWWTGKSKTLRMWPHLIAEPWMFWNSEAW